MDFPSISLVPLSETSLAAKQFHGYENNSFYEAFITNAPWGRWWFIYQWSSRPFEINQHTAQITSANLVRFISSIWKSNETQRNTIAREDLVTVMTKAVVSGARTTRQEFDKAFFSKGRGSIGEGREKRGLRGSGGRYRDCGLWLLGHRAEKTEGSWTERARRGLRANREKPGEWFSGVATRRLTEITCLSAEQPHLSNVFRYKTTSLARLLLSLSHSLSLFLYLFVSAM